MTSQGDGSPDPVDLGKHGGDAAGGQPTDGLDFDPYRFGLPDQPVPPEFAPPGYRAPRPAPEESPYSPNGPASPYGSGPNTAPGPAAGYGPADGYGSPGYGPPSPYRTPPNAPQSGPYGQSPYGYPGSGGPPPGYGFPGYGTPPKQGNGKAVASMVCGILSIVLCWFSFFDFVLVIPAFVLGLMVLSNKRSSGRGMAMAGVICAVLGAVLAIVLTVVYVHIEQDCRGVSSNQQQQCFRDKL